MTLRHFKGVRSAADAVGRVPFQMWASELHERLYEGGPGGQRVSRHEQAMILKESGLDSAEQLVDALEEYGTYEWKKSQALKAEALL